jgi:hypothetical protein
MQRTQPTKQEILTQAHSVKGTVLIELWAMTKPTQFWNRTNMKAFNYYNTSDRNVTISRHNNSKGCINHL